MAVQKQKRYAEARDLLVSAQASGQPFPEARQTDHFLGWANYYLGDLGLAKRHFQAHVGAMPTADDSWCPSSDRAALETHAARRRA